jgi:hypothetical protein
MAILSCGCVDDAQGCLPALPQTKAAEFSQTNTARRCSPQLKRNQIRDAPDDGRGVRGEPGEGAWLELMSWGEAQSSGEVRSETSTSPRSAR